MSTTTPGQDPIDYKRPYVPGQYDNKPHISLPDVREVDQWANDTYKCYDGRGEGEDREYYVLLLPSHIEGWVSVTEMDMTSRRVAAATVARFRKKYADSQGGIVASTPATITAGPSTTPYPVTPARNEDQADPGASQPGYTLRSSTKKLALRPSASPEPESPASDTADDDDAAPDCNEPLHAGESHSGPTLPCAYAHRHKTNPHHHFTVQAGEYLCSDADCAAYEDYRVCAGCHAAVFDKGFDDQTRAEIQAAFRRGAPVAAVPLCEECGVAKLAGKGVDVGVEKYSGCGCAGFAAEKWLCLGCRKWEVGFGLRQREAEMKARAQRFKAGVGEMKCECGAGVDGKTRYWLCKGCEGLVAKRVGDEWDGGMQGLMDMDVEEYQGGEMGEGV